MRVALLNENEIAPRTHNSGHHTIEASYTSQFEQQLRAVMDMPLGHTDLKDSALMMNILGEPGFTGNAQVIGMDDVLSLNCVYPHIYGKSITKPMRKMGHLTILFNEYEEALNKLSKIKSTLKIIS